MLCNNNIQYYCEHSEATQKINLNLDFNKIFKISKIFNFNPVNLLNLMKIPVRTKN